MTDLSPLRDRLSPVVASLCHTDEDVIALACEAWDREADQRAHAVDLNAALSRRALDAENAVNKLRAAAQRIVDL